MQDVIENESLWQITKKIPKVMQHESRAEQIFSGLLNEATLFHLHTIQ